MSVTFEKLNPSQLKKAAIVPQVLDNQWIPRKLLSKMIKKGQKLDEVGKERKKHILKEWRRALVYGEQVVVNRAFMFNNSVVVDDYDDAENRQQFKQLLNSGVIALYLLGEDNPDQKPRFQVDDRLWNTWLEIVNDTSMNCVRLDWGDQNDDFKRLARIFHNYIQTLNKQERAEAFAAHFGIRKREFPAFRERLREVAFYAFEMASKRDIIRNDLYENFIVEEGSNVALGQYSKKPFAAEIKQIVDLKYNVNLPDALGRYSLTPQDSPPRSALGDLDDVINSKPISNKKIDEILYALRRLAFENVAQGLYIKSLGVLNLSDVIKIRGTKEWHAYNRSIHKLLDNPLDFSQRSAEVYRRFAALNQVITRTKVESTKAKWEPWIKFMITLGTSTISLWLNPVDAQQRFMTTVATGTIATGVTPFVMRLSVAALAEMDADLEVSLDFMRGTIANGRDTWNEMLGQLKSRSDFQLVGKAVTDALDANQSPPETMGEL
ncbi:MAG TPA: hypothetical protein VK897_23555 [Anaerolineales bacterium]|nr:hypothetical protein [Anaerolineales bacterium]